jgi:hypothetical protein
VRETPSPKTLRKLGRIGSALHWANVRRLVAGFQPEADGGIPSAWSCDDKAFVIVNALFREDSKGSSQPPNDGPTYGPGERMNFGIAYTLRDARRRSPCDMKSFE